MSDLRLVYLSGEPGVGKSTLMARLTEPYARYPQPPEPRIAPARDLLIMAGISRAPMAVELGRRRDTFAGTDALPSAVIGDACAYLSVRALGEAPLVLAEGARLACRRFLTCAVDAGWQVTLVHLYGQQLAAMRRAQRATALGKREQDERWVKGRATAARNLANGAEGWGCRLLTLNVEAGDYPTAEAALIADVRGWPA